MVSSLERTYLLNFGILLRNMENVYWSLLGQNWEKEDSGREETLTGFPGKINI